MFCLSLSLQIIKQQNDIIGRNDPKERKKERKDCIFWVIIKGFPEQYFNPNVLWGKKKKKHKLIFFLEEQKKGK